MEQRLEVGLEPTPLIFAPLDQCAGERLRSENRNEKLVFVSKWIHRTLGHGVSRILRASIFGLAL